MEPARIDKETQVPLSVVAGLFSVGIGVTIAGTFWVAQVNARLSRIEDRLGVARAPSSHSLEPAWDDARASQPEPRAPLKGKK